MTRGMPNSGSPGLWNTLLRPEDLLPNVYFFPLLENFYTVLMEFFFQVSFLIRKIQYKIS